MAYFDFIDSTIRLRRTVYTFHCLCDRNHKIKSKVLKKKKRNYYRIQEREKDDNDLLKASRNGRYFQNGTCMYAPGLWAKKRKCNKLLDARKIHLQFKPKQSRGPFDATIKVTTNTAGDSNRLIFSHNLQWIFSVTTSPR